MSASKSAIDVMTAEETALLNSMRNETEAPEVNDAPIEAADADTDIEDAPEAIETPEAEAAAEGKPQSRYTKRVFELTEKARVAEEGRIAAEQARAVSEGVVSERLRLLTEAAQSALQQQTPPPAAPAVTIPDIETDPVGHFKTQFELQQKQLAEQNAILQGFAQQQEHARQVAELRAWGSAQEAEFSAKEPAYNEAMQFMLERRKVQLTAIGVSDPAAQQQVIANDITQIAIKSRSENANLGERLYKVAESYGYQKKAPEPVIPPLEAGLPAADRAATAERGRANSTTIANVGASTPIGLTPDKIAAMPEAQFLKYVDDIKAKGGSALRDLLGH